MKRWSAVFAGLAIALVLTLASCDAMFEKNLFAGMTQKKLTADTVSEMDSSEVAALTESQAQMAMLEEDPDAKAAAIAVLEAEYDTPDGAATADGQIAAIAAATIIIQTVPEAASFSSSAVTLATSLMGSEGEEPDIGSALADMLPADVVAAIDAGETTPPDAFAAIVEAFVQVEGVYDDLGAGLAMTGDAFVTDEITSDEQMSMAINVIIGFALTNVQDEFGATPATTEELTSLLWEAVTDDTATITFPSFTTMPAELETLLTAAGLASLFN